MHEENLPEWQTEHPIRLVQPEQSSKYSVLRSLFSTPVKLNEDDIDTTEESGIHQSVTELSCVNPPISRSIAS